MVYLIKDMIKKLQDKVFGDFYYRECRRMWNWLRCNPGKDKKDYAKYRCWKDPNYEFIDCPACRVASERFSKMGSPKKIGICGYCPIDWSSVNVSSCFNKNAPFLKWCKTFKMTDISESIRLSKKYADEMYKLVKTWK